MISDVELNDCKVIAEIHKKYFEEPWSEDFFCQALKEYRYIFIKYARDNQIIGFCLCLAIKPEIEILSICTDEKYRKIGVASSLISYIKNLPSFDTFFLEVSINNVAAINLYKKSNFTQEYIRKGYYIEKGVPTDAIIMKCITGD